MSNTGKSFIITLLVVLLIAYALVVSAIGVHSFIKTQELQRQLLSLTLVRQELERRAGAISSQLEDYENERKLLEQSLSKLNKESKDKLAQITSEMDSYKNRVGQLSQNLERAHEKLIALERENQTLKQAPVADKKKQGELTQALSKKEEEVKALSAKLDELQSELKNKTATLHYNLAVNFSQDRDFDNAIIEYEKALKIDPDHIASHYNLGILCEEYSKDYAQAIKHYRRYLQLSPDAQDAPQIERWIQQLEEEQPEAIGQ